jgi:hypothetical protein
MSDHLESLSRRELQVLAKEFGLKANAKSSELIEMIREAQQQNAPKTSDNPIVIAPISEPAIDFSSSEAAASAMAKVHELTAAMSSANSASSPMSAVDTSAPAPQSSRKRWSSSRKSSSRVSLLAVSPMEEMVTIAVVASPSAASPTEPMQVDTPSSAPRRKWDTRAEQRTSLLQMAIMSPNAAAVPASKPQTPAAAAVAPVEDDLMAELTRRVQQRVDAGDVPTIAPLESAVKTPKAANMPNFDRMHAANSHRKVSIKEHFDAKQKRAQALTSQHQLIKTPTAKPTTPHALAKPSPSVHAGSSAKVVARPMVSSKLPAPKPLSSVTKATPVASVAPVEVKKFVARPAPNMNKAPSIQPRVISKENSAAPLNRMSISAGGFVRKEAIKPLDISAVKPKINTNLSVARNIKQPVFASRDQKAATVVAAVKDQRTLMIEERRAKLAAVAQAAAAARTKAVVHA